MTPRWKDIIEPAAQYAKCTPRQAAAAWRAAAEALNNMDTLTGRWIITGMGSLEWKNGTGTPVPIWVKAGDAWQYFTRLTPITGYYAPSADDFELWAASGYSEYYNDGHEAGGVSEITPYYIDLVKADQPALTTTEFPPLGAPAYWFISEFYGEPFDVPPPPKAAGGGPLKIRLTTHKGVIERHRLGDI